MDFYFHPAIKFGRPAWATFWGAWISPSLVLILSNVIVTKNELKFSKKMSNFLFEDLMKIELRFCLSKLRGISTDGTDRIMIG